jgi:hypothetical protein
MWRARHFTPHTTLIRRPCTSVSVRHLASTTGATSTVHSNRSSIATPSPSPPSPSTRWSTRYKQFRSHMDEADRTFIPPYLFNDGQQFTPTPATAGLEFLVSTTVSWWSDRTIQPVLYEYLKDMHRALAANHTSRVFELYASIQRDLRIKKLHVEVFNVMLQACAKLKQGEA